MVHYYYHVLITEFKEAIRLTIKGHSCRVLHLHIMRAHGYSVYFVAIIIVT